VTSSNRDGIREATKHLLSHGYKNIAFINGQKGVSVAQERLAGYQEALQAARVPLQETYIIHSDFRQEGGRIAMCRLLDLPRPPRAAVVANNLMTLGALQAIHERGLRIPDEVAIVGFDDMPWATSLRPPLTAVAQPAEEIGRAAAQLLLERLREPRRLPRRVVLPTRLIIRASCGAHAPAGTEPAIASSARKNGQSNKSANSEHQSSKPPPPAGKALGPVLRKFESRSNSS
jgi:DNA-binding LacI/PurR family transcriptional regulator